MKPVSFAPAAIAQPTPQEFELSGYWTALGIGALDRHLEALTAPEKTEVVVDGTGVEGFDTVGVWIVQKFLQRLRGNGHTVQLRGWSPRHAKLLDMVAQRPDTRPPSLPHPSSLERIGRTAGAAGEQTTALLSFVGESVVALAGSIVHPARFRWRPILYNILSET